MEDNGKRMLSWDIVKGITILIMIVGHVASIPQQLRNFIFSFHMPVFFVANAYFIKNYQIGYNLKRSSKSLLLPYILVCVVTAMLCVNINVIRCLRISHMMKPENRLSPILCNIKSQRGWTWDTYRLSLRIATSRQVHLAQNPSEKS